MFRSDSILYISEQFKNNKISTSFEVFPPKNNAPYEPVKNAVDSLAVFNPDFISVTYGAGGGTSQNTPKIAAHIENALSIPALAHLTCASSTKEELSNIIDDLKSSGIQNILALRGDLPENYNSDDNNYYHFAYELVKAIKNKGDFCVGAACYPECHPEAESLQKDIKNLKIKVDSGVDFLVTQMFFDNSVLYSYLYRTLKAGIDVPIIAGVMPVINVKQIKRSCDLSGTSLPPRFRRMMDRFCDDPEALKQAGIAYATEQIIDLISNGVNGIHIYTMNKPEVAGQIMNNLSSVLSSR